MIIRHVIKGNSGPIEKRSSAALRCKSHRSTYIYIRLVELPPRYLLKAT